MRVHLPSVGQYLKHVSIRHFAAYDFFREIVRTYEVEPDPDLIISLILPTKVNGRIKRGYGL